MRTVRAFGKELSEVKAYRQKTDDVFSLAKKEAVIRAGFYGVVSVCDLIVDIKSTVSQSFLWCTLPSRLCSEAFIL